MPKTINTSTTLSQINIAAQKAKIIASYQALINTINSDLSDTPSFVVNGVTYTRDQLVQDLTTRITAAKNTLAARTAMHQAVASEQATAAQVDPVRAGFKTYLQSRFGKNSAMLQKYGYTPVKPTQKAVSTKATAAALNLATRQLRGTTGKKAKSVIKATPATAAPPTATTAPAPAAAAAPAPAAATASVTAPAAAKPAPSNPGATA
jgi:hypothetical protein